MPKSVVLVGFMGAGKTATGTLLAARLGVPFIDTDARIEAAAGRAISAIFKHDGEAAFRALETATLAGLAPEPAVYATGGGIVTRPENWPLLKRLGTVVHLHGSAEVLFARVARETHRPLLNTANPRETFEHLLQTRDALYRQADLTVDTDGRTPAQITEEILKKI
jgi:shikimate kinase